MDKDLVLEFIREQKLDSYEMYELYSDIKIRWNDYERSRKSFKEWMDEWEPERKRTEIVSKFFEDLSGEGVLLSVQCVVEKRKLVKEILADM